jgi:exonuclease III
MVGAVYFECNQSNFTIMHQNIASILSKQSLLDITLLELRKLDKEPDIICLSETFLSAGYEKYVKISDYVMVAQFCRDKKRGGTCIMAKGNINCNELHYIAKHAGQKVFEICGVMITDYNLIVISLYRTPSSDPYIFLNKLNNLLDDI